jgi:hypothetical protein
MSERSHGAMRPSLPRSSDLATVAEPVASPTAGRDAQGRFAAANPWAAAAKWRSLIAEGLGRDLEGQAGELGKRAYRLFRAFLADLPVDCATVRSLVAQRARAATLADAYARRGQELGLDNPLGAAALAEALKWDARAERLTISSIDVANRMLAVAKKRGDTIDLSKAIEVASQPRSRT